MARRVQALLLALACCGALWFARGVLHRTRGMSAQYFSNAQWSAPAAVSVVDTEISTSQIEARWEGSPPAIFTARWSGYLVVGQSDTYRFATTSDDGSWLYVDNRLVVDNSGSHGAETREGTVGLDAGPHLIVIEYAQLGGSYAVEWAWARNGRPLSPVPGWLLSQTRTTYRVAVAGRAIDWMFAVACGVALVLLVAVLVSPRGNRVSIAIGRYPRAACLLLFVALTIVETWPLAAHPATYSRNDNADTVLNEWALAWIAHQAPRAPLRLFDANIFYPERRTLAYSEAMVVQGILGSPLRWAGASPVLTYNVVLLAGFMLTGWAMCLVVSRWTGDWTAGIVAGILTAFNAHNLTRLPHLQTQHVEFFPLALAALDALVREPRLRHAAALAGSFILQALTSYYLLVITAAALVSAFLVRDDAWRRGRLLIVGRYLLIASAVVGIVLLPYLWPYWRVHHDQGFTRSLQQVLPAQWRDYLTTAARFDHWLLEAWSGNAGLFPGFIALALSAVAVFSATAFRDRRARMCLAFGVVGLLLSFGTATPGYAWLYRALPPLAGIRAVSRFGYLPIVAVAILAGYGVAELRRHAGVSSIKAAIALVVPLLVTAETLAAPIRFVPFHGIPAIYRRLASDPRALIADLPFPSTRGLSLNTGVMLNTTDSFNPMLNGYSGFIPESYGTHYEALRTFPDAQAIAALHAWGVRYVVVHLDALEPVAVGTLGRTSALQPIAAEGTVALYRVTGE